MTDSQTPNQAPSSAPQCDKGHPLRIDLNAAMNKEPGAGGGISGEVTQQAPPPPEPTNEDMERLAKELGMSLETKKPPRGGSANTGSESSATPAVSRPPPAAAVQPAQASSPPKPLDVNLSPPKPKPKAKPLPKD